MPLTRAERISPIPGVNRARRRRRLAEGFALDVESSSPALIVDLVAAVLVTGLDHTLDLLGIIALGPPIDGETRGEILVELGLPPSARSETVRPSFPPRVDGVGQTSPPTILHPDPPLLALRADAQSMRVPSGLESNRPD